MQATFESMHRASRGSWPSATLRQDRIRRLRRMLTDEREAICSAISADFGHRARTESLTLEFVPLTSACRHAERALPRWMAGESRRAAWFTWPATARIQPIPLGVVGIMSAWNYPLLLALGPAIGALAAGNRVLIKPSPHSPSLAAVLSAAIQSRFADDEMRVIVDDGELGPSFAGLAFDHLVFTGSGSVGRRVMAAAANNLTPVTLELGGRCPAIVAPEAKPEQVAHELLRGKLMNAGQSCVAPDHVLVSRTRLPALVEQLKLTSQRLYPEWFDDAEYSAIGTSMQFERLTRGLDDARERGASVVPLGQMPPQGYQEDISRGVRSRRMQPHLVVEPPFDCELLQDEIFGPVLPILAYDDLETALAGMMRGAAPLAIIAMGTRRADRRRIEAGSRSGSLTYDAPLVHFAQDQLPLGGLAESGIGQYHGWEGFARFSHCRSIYRQFSPNGLPISLPPHRRSLNRRVLEFLLRILSGSA